MSSSTANKQQWRVWPACAATALPTAHARDRGQQNRWITETNRKVSKFYCNEKMQVNILQVSTVSVELQYFYCEFPDFSPLEVLTLLHIYIRLIKIYIACDLGFCLVVACLRTAPLWSSVCWAPYTVAWRFCRAGSTQSHKFLLFALV